MDLVELEIRDLLVSHLVTSHVAESGTTTTNIHITSHGLVDGDNLINVTRGNAKRAVTIVDVDNVTVDTVANQTTGDSITFPKIKRFYVGKLDPQSIQLNLLPLASIYGTRTSLVSMATQADKYAFDLTIEVYINTFTKVAEADVINDVLQAQKTLKLIMEERDGTTNKPIASSLLGCLRQNIRGTHFLFTEIDSIEYDRAVGTTFMKATLKLKATQSYQPRP